MNSIELLLESDRGIYLPKNFADEVDLSKFAHLDSGDIDVLKMGPDHEWYWEAWNSVLANATVELEGKTYSLYQDGDLFLVAWDNLTDEEYEEFTGAPRND